MNGGQPPGVGRSLQLDPGAAKALSIADRWPAIPFERLTPEDVRDGMRRELALAGAPEPVAEVCDLAIRRPDGSDLSLRIYRPSTDEESASAVSELAPVLFIHGGGWIAGSLESHDGLCRALANRANAPLISIEYRLAPEHRFPAGLDDCLLAAGWIEGRPSVLGACSGAFAVAGDSAGGNLAAALCLRRLELGLRQPVGQALLYPALDPQCDTASYQEAGSDYFLTTELMRWLWRHYLACEPTRHLAAPIFAHTLEGLAPALVVTAQFDPLRDEGEAYGEMLSRAGVSTSTIRYGGQIHGFLTWDRYIPQAAKAKDQIGLWLRARCSLTDGSALS